MEKNIYSKIQQVKQEFLKRNIKKSGKNKFANYSYYELADITPNIIELCKEVSLFTKFTFSNELATLIIVNIDNPSETEVYTSPMKDLELKGANSIQALGGTETYQRRYLYMAAFDIIENDMFDGVVNKKEDLQEEEVNYKQLVKVRAESLGFDFKSFCVEKKLSAKTTQEEAKAILEELNANYR